MKKKIIKVFAKVMLFFGAILACAKYIDDMDVMILACMAITTIALVILEHNINN